MYDEILRQYVTMQVKKIIHKTKKITCVLVILWNI